MAIENWRELARAELVQRAEEGLDAQVDVSRVKDAASWNAVFGSMDLEAVNPSFRFVEPSDLEGIRKRRRSAEHRYARERVWRDLDERVYGAWIGRCAGCLLGKPVEGWSADRIGRYLAFVGESQFTDYLPPAVEATGDRAMESYKHTWLRGRITEMPRDDDLDYTVLGLHLLEEKGCDFSPRDVGALWLERLPIARTFTAERVAYRNLVNGHEPPETATFANPYREFIGAQITADIYGYVAPGRPSLAAELAWRDASLSHTKNGIYGAMFVAATISAAFVADDVQEAIFIGMSEIPDSSRLYAAIRHCLTLRREAGSWDEAFAKVQEAYGGYHWVHTINNAALVALALLYGEHDFDRTIGLAVRGGWDTDCNGATAGSILGAFLGAKAIDAKWTMPLRDRLRSDVAGYDGAKISELAARTAALARKFSS